MRRLWILPAMLAVFGWALGCGGSNTDQAKATDGASAQKSEPASQTMAANDAADGAGAETQLASVVLTGKLGCGHCTFHVKDSCSLAMEAQDGTVYMLDAGDRQQELMDVRYDRPQVKVTGELAMVDGQRVIHAKSVDVL